MVIYMEATETTTAPAALEWCDGCEQEVDSTEFVETSPQTWEEPADGVMLCEECIASDEAAWEDYEVSRAEDRAYWGD